MSASAYSPSIRDLVLVVVFQLGLCVILLAEVVDATRGFDTLYGLLGQFVGGVTVAGVLVLFAFRWRIAAE